MERAARPEYEGASESFGEGRLVACQVGEDAVVATRVEGRVCAVAGTCPHRGAPLAEGILDGRRLICPWHHATFDVTSGALLDAPALDPLPRYQVEEHDGAVTITSPSPPPATARRARDRSRGVVIAGGGAAGVAAAALLRERGYDKAITILSADERAPYDRTELSKLYLAGESGLETLPLREGGFYAEAEIDLRLRTRVAGVDPARRRLQLAGGGEYFYDSLLLATGSEPRRLPAPGLDLDRVFTLRSHSDCDRIATSAPPGAPAVVVGSSFIGMEVAAALRQRGCRVTVVSNERRPYERIVGPAMSDFFRRRHEEEGVEFRWDTEITAAHGTGTVEAVTLSDGAGVDASLVVLGLGVQPSLPALPTVRLNDDGGVDTDAAMRLAPAIWAAGDVACFPAPLVGRTRVEHWRVAEQQGRVAALSMLGEDVRFDAVPFFWTLQLGVSMRYAGWPAKWDRETVLGDPHSDRFLCLYSQNDRVVSAASVERDQELAAIEVLLGSGRMPPASRLAGDTVDLVQLAGYRVSR